jgi:hypothetical protein
MPDMRYRHRLRSRATRVQIRLDRQIVPLIISSSLSLRLIVDASTKAVTVWYVDYNGYLVRGQPLD